MSPGRFRARDRRRQRRREALLPLIPAGAPNSLWDAPPFTRVFRWPAPWVHRRAQRLGDSGPTPLRFAPPWVRHNGETTGFLDETPTRRGPRTRTSRRAFLRVGRTNCSSADAGLVPARGKATRACSSACARRLTDSPLRVCVDVGQMKLHGLFADLDSLLISRVVVPCATDEGIVRSRRVNTGPLAAPESLSPPAWLLCIRGAAWYTTPADDWRTMSTRSRGGIFDDVGSCAGAERRAYQVLLIGLREGYDLHGGPAFPGLGNGAEARACGQVGGPTAAHPVGTTP
jgi:hypothetical protein